MTRKLLAGLFAVALFVPTVGCGEDNKKNDLAPQNMAAGGHAQPVSQATKKTGGNVPPKSD
jgi:hypothetical protein